MGAAIIVAPVAGPSSTTIATRLAGSSDGRTGVYSARRRRRLHLRGDRRIEVFARGAGAACSAT
jgi:hypothetical protein